MTKKLLLLVVVVLVLLAVAAVLRLGERSGRDVTGDWSVENELKALSALFGRQIPENPLPEPADTEEPVIPTTTPTEPSKSVSEVELLDPLPGGSISSPYLIKGRARGSWFFEAVLPVELIDENGNSLVKAQGRAIGDWMTAGWVNFESRLEFNPGTAQRGEIIIKKDNPSGLPENDARVSYPVLFR
ncbi:MAG: Gmad2 immunoglobulin-like domain-containing protein [Bacillota bacterium]